jgi:hypothetical protein
VRLSEASSDFGTDDTCSCENFGLLFFLFSLSLESLGLSVSLEYTCTRGLAWSDTTQAHKSTYLIIGRAVPPRVPSAHGTAHN